MLTELFVPILSKDIGSAAKTLLKENNSICISQASSNSFVKADLQKMLVVPSSSPSHLGLGHQQGTYEKGEQEPWASYVGRKPYAARKPEHTVDASEEQQSTMGSKSVQCSCTHIGGTDSTIKKYLLSKILSYPELLQSAP